MEIREHELIKTEVHIMGDDELQEIAKDLPVVDKAIKAAETDIDNVRKERHLPEPTGKEDESERKEGFNQDYSKKWQKVFEDPEASEFAGFVSEFPEMVEKIIAEIFREGSRFENLHPKEAIILRHLLIIYEEVKRFHAEEKSKQ
jgi:hypothetical protein